MKVIGTTEIRPKLQLGDVVRTQSGYYLISNFPVSSKYTAVGLCGSTHSCGTHDSLDALERALQGIAQEYYSKDKYDIQLVKK